MGKKTIRNIIVGCLIVAVSAVLIHAAGLNDFNGRFASDCEGNGTCGMKYFKKLLNEKDN